MSEKEQEQIAEAEIDKTQKVQLYRARVGQGE